MAGRNRRKCKCCLKLFRPDLRNPPSPALLLGNRLQSGQQGRQPGALARGAGEPGLLPRPCERRSGAGGRWRYPGHSVRRSIGQ